MQNQSVTERLALRSGDLTPNFTNSNFTNFTQFHIGNNAIKRWSAATGQVTTVVESGLSFPNGVAVNAAGDGYIADSGNHAIKKWNRATNTVETLISSGLSDPTVRTAHC